MDTVVDNYILIYAKYYMLNVYVIYYTFVLCIIYCMLCVIYHFWCRGDSSLYWTSGFTIALNVVLWTSQLMPNTFPKDDVLLIFVRHQSRNFVPA